MPAVRLGKLLANGRLKVGRERGVEHPLANLRAGLGQCAHVFGIECGKPVGNARVEPALREKLPKRMRRGGKPARHPHAGGGQLADHFAERGVLAAYRLDVGHSQMFKRRDQGGRQICCGHGKAP